MAGVLWLIAHRFDSLFVAAAFLFAAFFLFFIIFAAFFAFAALVVFITLAVIAAGAVRVFTFRIITSHCLFSKN